MSARGRAALVLVASTLALAACASPFARLPEHDQLLLACDGLATTMRHLERQVAAGTLRDPATLQSLRAASLTVEESCKADEDFTAALRRLADQSALLLAARERAAREGTTWK